MLVVPKVYVFDIRSDASRHSTGRVGVRLIHHADLPRCLHLDQVLYYDCLTTVTSYQ